VSDGVLDEPGLLNILSGETDHLNDWNYSKVQIDEYDACLAQLLSACPL